MGGREENRDRITRDTKQLPILSKRRFDENRLRSTGEKTRSKTYLRKKNAGGAEDGLDKVTTKTSESVRTEVG